MTYREEKQVRLRRQGSKRAITLAMQGRWREAAAANRGVIENFPHDVEAYNRLGKAYMELREYSQAKEAYSRAVELDQYNVVAKKNLQRLFHLGETIVSSEGEAHKTNPQYFIEEIGKTGVVNLYSLALPEVLARVMAGDAVYLKIDGHSLMVENGRGEYLGQVDTRYGQRLVRLMEGGNKYTAAIVSSAKDATSVIIREVYQDSSQAGQLSFPNRRTEGAQPYVSDRIFRGGAEYEEELVETPGHTIVGEKKEVLSEKSPKGGGDEIENEEQEV